MNLRTRTMNAPGILPTLDAGAGAETDPYVRAFDRIEREGCRRTQPAWLLPFRKAGLARFAELGFPTLKHEDWRYTNVAPIKELPFHPVLDPPARVVAPETLGAFAFADLPGDRLVFVDGHFVPGLSHLSRQASGVRITSLAAALESESRLLEKHWGHGARPDRNPFTAMNEAFFRDGAFIYVPAGRRVEEPVQLVFITAGDEAGTAAQPRNLIVAEPESRVTVIEQYVGCEARPHLTNAVTELIAGDGAFVEHLRLQDEPADALHIGALQALLGRGCRLLAHSFALGGRLARHTIHVTLGGEGLEAVLNGLYLGRGDQLLDHHMTVDHAQPRCASHEYFNGVLAGHARGVFYGRIRVRPQAQKTDAKQTNKNLLLSADASVQTRPQLEIYADDVKCTHGATVGQLNADSIFYLRARGIPEETARRMLVRAFTSEIIERVECLAAREELDKLVWGRLASDDSASGN